jgi:hypothetical protein
MIDATTRLHGVEQLIEGRQYFLIHAAQQSGKTTCLRDLSQRLNTKGQYYTLYCSLESVQGVNEPERGIPAILDCLFVAMQKLPVSFTWDKSYGQDKKSRSLVLLTLFLTDLSKCLDKPLVIFFDEADCLSEETLISFLGQLRDGHNSQSFPHSIALVGMCDTRDYKARISPDSETKGSVSPFNIITESLTLQNFTKEEIVQLYKQHTDETGQIFEDTAVERVWEQTQGQPWFVNAVAHEVIDEILQSDYTKPVTAELVYEASQNIFLTRPTHIDNLLGQLR